MPTATKKPATKRTTNRSRPGSVGYKIGARKVDAEEFLPDPGDWEETNILFDCGDGWFICEDRTEYDRRLMARLTLTCVGSLLDRCDPFYFEVEKLRKEEQLRKIHDTPYYRKCRSSDQIEALITKDLGTWEKTIKPPFYKLAHVRDAQDRPRACILLVRADVKAEPKGYTKYQPYEPEYIKSDDLGQSHPITIGDKDWLVLEVRIGTGKAAPMVAEEKAIEWYKNATGKWDEEAYLRAQVQRKHYEAFKTFGTDLYTLRRGNILVAVGAA